jgi:7-cyano-7-deazaguanine synthase
LKGFILKTHIILSGGADSATLAYHLADAGHSLTAISYDYGQRHRKELDSAAAIANALGIGHSIVDISGIAPLLKGSSLTDNVDVPHGHYQADNMLLTVVPNRNTIMLSIAWGVACSAGSEFLAYGAHAGDHFIYPDCRPDYVAQLEIALRMGTEGHRPENMRLIAPFVDWNKGRIIARGLELGVPYELTWTCYEGGEKSCGKCGSCVERIEAFGQAGSVDPLPYADA